MKAQLDRIAGRRQGWNKSKWAHTHHRKKSKNLWPFISAGLLLHLQILRQAEDKAIGNALPAGQRGCWNAEAQLAKCHASNLTLVKQTKPARFWFWSVELLEPCHDQLYQQSPGSYKHVVLRFTLSALSAMLQCFTSLQNLMACRAQWRVGSPARSLAVLLSLASKKKCKWTITKAVHL